MILNSDGEPFEKPISNSLLSTAFFRREYEKVFKNEIEWQNRRKIAELRESCGVKSEQTFTVNVRSPPRYA
jgi:hypothetical protein